MDNLQNKPTPLREIDFSHYIRHYFNIFWNWKWWIIISGPLVFAFALFYFVKFASDNPELNATVLIGIENTKTVTAVMDFVSVDNSNAGIIKTRTFLKDIVEKLSLQFQLKHYPRNKVFSSILVDSLAKPGKYNFVVDKENEKSYKILFNNKRLGYNNRTVASGKLLSLDIVELPGIIIQFNRSFLRDPRDITFSIISVPVAINHLYKSINLKMPDLRRQRYHIEVSLKGNDYGFIAKLLNTIADAFIEKKLLFRKRKTRNVLAVLKKQFEKANTEHARAKRRLETFRTSNPTIGLTQSAQRTVNSMIALETNNFNMKSVLKEANELQAKFENSPKEERVHASEEILIYLIAQNITSAKVLQGEFNRLLEDKRALQNNYASTHPLMRENQLALEKALKNAYTALLSFITSTKDKATQRASGIKSLTRKLQQLPIKELEMAELQRQHKVSAEIYSTVLDKYNQAKVAEIAEVADVYIMDYAVPPIPPPSNLLKILAICFILGILVALCPSIFFDLINKTVQTEYELQKMTNMIVLESIPKIKTAKRKKDEI